MDIGIYIAKHVTKRNKYIKLYNYYKGESLAIETKEVSETAKTNNKLKNNYQGLIIDQKNGYLTGNPLRINLDKENYQENIYELANMELKKFRIRNEFPDFVSELEKMSSICGVAYVLCYYDTEGQERVEILNPANVIYLKDEGYSDNDEAIYYYDTVVLNEDGTEVIVSKAEFYDGVNVTYYKKDGDKYVLDNAYEENPRPHLSSYMPIVKVKNNDEEIGDFERVIELIDAYNNLNSTIMDEVDAFRMAYLLILGAELDADVLAEAKKLGAFSGLDKEDDIRWITKNINDAFLENQKNTLNENIFKFSAAVDMTDEKFSGGAESGESRKWKLIALENKASIKERKMTSALRKVFKIIFSMWALKNNTLIDYLDIDIQFSRNLPVDLSYLSDIAGKLYGLVSEEARLKQIGAIIGDDIELEKQRMKEDRLSSVVNDPYEEELMNPNEQE